MRKLLTALLIVALLIGLAAVAAAKPSEWQGVPAILRLEERLEQLNGAECATEIVRAATITRTHQFEVHIRCDR